MFDCVRYNAGILIELLEGHRIDTNDEKIEETKNEIGCVCLAIVRDLTSGTCTRPTVEHMNMFAPQHFRVYKEVWKVF
ncbi:hypothetical protein BS17DRAFT_782381 [Gyrodon lividus]|nr:hypothetical protein BS17DRAFT_782381 [Gyrodon lividus]